MLAQLPAGFLTDRHGARVMLVASASLLAAGQLLLALSSALPLAVLGRVLVGVGDAIVFVAVLALLPRWFPARRVPMVTQLTTILCQAGQVLSAVPFLALLHVAGWTAAFGSAAAASALVAVLALVVVRDAPRRRARARARGVRPRDRRRLRAVWRRPGTRVGFFSHLAVQFSMNVFTLLWGVPWLVSAQGLSTRGGRRAGDPVRRVHDRVRPDRGGADDVAAAAPLTSGARGRRRSRPRCGRSCSSLPGPAPRGCWWR